MAVCGVAARPAGDAARYESLRLRSTAGRVLWGYYTTIVSHVANARTSPSFPCLFCIFRSSYITISHVLRELQENETTYPAKRMSARASGDISRSGSNLERNANDVLDVRILNGALLLDSDGKFKLALVVRIDRLHKI